MPTEHFRQLLFNSACNCNKQRWHRLPTRFANMCGGASSGASSAIASPAVLKGRTLPPAPRPSRPACGSGAGKIILFPQEHTCIYACVYIYIYMGTYTGARRRCWGPQGFGEKPRPGSAPGAAVGGWERQPRRGEGRGRRGRAGPSVHGRRRRYPERQPNGNSGASPSPVSSLHPQPQAGEAGGGSAGTGGAGAGSRGGPARPFSASAQTPAGGRMPGGGRPPPRERGLAPEPPRREGGGGRGEEEKGAGGKWGSCASPAPPRAGAMGRAGGARAAPSLLLSLLLGASAPLWLRAETLGECGAGPGGSAGAAPRAGGERRVPRAAPAGLASPLCGSVA